MEVETNWTKKKRKKKTKSDKDPNLLFKKRLAFCFPSVFLLEYFDILEILCGVDLLLFFRIVSHLSIMVFFSFSPVSQPASQSTIQNMMFYFGSRQRTLLVYNKTNIYVYLPKHVDVLPCTIKKMKAEKVSLHTWVEKTCGSKISKHNLALLYRHFWLRLKLCNIFFFPLFFGWCHLNVSNGNDRGIICTSERADNVLWM